MCVCVCVCVCVCMWWECVCVYLCVCLFYFIVMPEFRAAMVCCEYFFLEDFYLCITDIHKKNFQDDNCAKEFQLNQAMPQKVKDNSYKLSKRSTVKNAN